MSPLELRACALQNAAIERVKALTAELRKEGWDFVVVQLARIVSDETESLVPGASLFQAAGVMGPALPREADTLRSMADGMDAEFRKLGCLEATEGWRQELPPTSGVGAAQ